MKKFFTLFIATAVAISMSALPQLKKDQLGQVQKTELNAKKAAKLEKAMELSKTSERKALVRQVKEQAVSATLAPVAKVAPAAKAAKEEITLNFDAFAVAPEYYPETGDWFISLSCDDESKPEYGYIVKFDYFGPEDNYCGTFTTDDFDHNYTFMYTPTAAGAVYYDEVTLTVAETKVSETLTKVTLDATIVAQDGNTYKVSCVHETITPKSEVEALLMNATLTQTEENFTFAGKNDVMDATLVFDYPELVLGATYTEELLDVEASKFVYNGVEVKPMSIEALVQVGDLDSDGALEYVAQASFLSTDTIQYEVIWVSPMPAPTDTVDIVCPNLAIDDSWAAFFGVVLVEASNAEWEVLGNIVGYAAEEGDYTTADGGLAISLTNNNTYEEIGAILANVTLSLDEEENWVLTGSMLGTDNVVYNLDLSWNVPTPTKTVKVSFETSSEFAFWPSLDYDLQLSNEDEFFAASLDVFGVQPGETFGFENMDAYYAAVIDYTTGEEGEVADAVNGKLEQVGDTTKISASLICFNAVQYDVELWYVAPTPTETVEMTIPVQFTNYLETEGLYQLSGYTADSVYTISFMPYAEEVAGTFVNDGLFGKFGAEGGRYDFNADYTYVATVTDPAEGLYDVHAVAKGQMTVTMDADNNITALVDVVCDNAVRYVLTLTSKYDTPHLDYDAEEPAIDRTYTAADMVEVNDYIADYGYIGLNATAADGSDMVMLAFIVEEADADIVIPVGTYPIDYSNEYGTVVANTGVQGDAVYPSFYAQLDEEGYLNVPLWMFVGGTVEVSKTDAGYLHMEVNAVNSYNVPVHIVYDGTPTGLENVEVENINGVKKMMVDGQLVIVRDGKAFNAMGAQVK